MPNGHVGKPSGTVQAFLELGNLLRLLEAKKKERLRKSRNPAQTPGRFSGRHFELLGSLRLFGSLKFPVRILDLDVI